MREMRNSEIKSVLLELNVETNDLKILLKYEISFRSRWDHDPRFGNGGTQSSESLSLLLPTMPTILIA